MQMRPGTDESQICTVRVVQEDEMCFPELDCELADEEIFAMTTYLQKGMRARRHIEQCRKVITLKWWMVYCTMRIL